MERARRLTSLEPGSIWNEPKDRMMALLKKERHLFVTWDALRGSHFEAWNQVDSRLRWRRKLPRQVSSSLVTNSITPPHAMPK